jgi:hypothetical protein
MVPAAVIATGALEVPSPQLTATVYGPVALDSVKLPKANDLAVPFVAAWDAAATAPIDVTGLVTVAVNVATFDEWPAESVT